MPLCPYYCLGFLHCLSHHQNACGCGILGGYVIHNHLLFYPFSILYKQGLCQLSALVFIRDFGAGGLQCQFMVPGLWHSIPYPVTCHCILWDGEAGGLTGVGIPFALAQTMPTPRLAPAPPYPPPPLWHGTTYVVAKFVPMLGPWFALAITVPGASRTLGMNLARETWHESCERDLA